MNEIVAPYVIYLNKDKPKLLSLVPSDAGSRYKTRQLQIQVVGKSKMIKTVLVNILDVAKDMQIPPSYIGTFMGYEIGAQAKFDHKKPERQQAYLSGEHDPKDLSKFMLKFINEVILCPNCNLPEILIGTEGEKVFGRCRACGGSSPLNITNTKFKKYVVTHPPSQKGPAFAGSAKAASKKEVKEKKDKEAKTKTKTKKSQDDEEEGEEEGGDVVWYSDTSEEAARKRREAMLPESFLKDEKKPNGKEEKKSNGEANGHKKENKINPELQKLIKEGSVDKLKQHQESNSLSNEAFVSMLFDHLVAGDASNPTTPLKESKDTLMKFISTPTCQVALLNSLANHCEINQPALLPKFALLLKELFDLDLVEEENIFKWYEDKSNGKEKAKEQAAPFIKWLKEAEEEDSDEGED